jgi:hypothetical protein
MPGDPGERYDFFLSRRGSVAGIAQEVSDVLTEKGYRVFVQDYDIPITANFIEEIRSSRAFDRLQHSGCRRSHLGGEEVAVDFRTFRFAKLEICCADR